MANIILQRPQAGQILAVEPQTGDSINLEFSANEALLSRDGDNLIFSFEDGSSIELTNFYTAYSSENMPEFVIDGNIIPGEAFFAALGEDLMPAAGNASSPQGSGTTVGTEGGNLHDGIDSRGGADAGQNNTNNPEPTTTFDLATGNVVANADTGTEAGAGTGSDSDSDSGSGSDAAPVVNPYSAKDDLLASDAGANLTGNLLANDDLPAGTVITTITAPAGWTASVDEATNTTTFTSPDGNTSLSISANGDYVLSTSVKNVGMDDLDFGYVAVDQDGNTYNASVTVGNADASGLQIGTLQGGSAVVTDTATGNTYEYKFTDYSSDSEVGNQHVNGMLLGNGDDTITVNTAIGSQGNLDYADTKGEDTFIYGDSLDNTSQDMVGNDVINVGTLDGTKIRADGNLMNGVDGGDDTVNVENMEHGSIIGDGWTLDAGSDGGDDVINVGTMNSGEIYGDGRDLSSTSQGGDDQISVETIDTTAAGRQEVEIFAGSGDDTVSVDNIAMGSGDYVRIDGGLGDDIFNFNDAADNTMAIRGDNIFIAGNNATITNFEGVSTGGGDDLLKLYSGTDDIISVDTGDGMDVLLAGVSDLAGVSNMLENGSITNTEVLVFSDTLNNSGTTSTNDLFNKLDGVSQDENGQVSVGEGWTQNTDAPTGYSSFTYDGGDTDASNDMTILVAQTQLNNTPS